jgi:ubiquitin-protein ligase
MSLDDTVDYINKIIKPHFFALVHDDNIVIANHDKKYTFECNIQLDLTFKLTCDDELINHYLLNNSYFSFSVKESESIFKNICEFIIKNKNNIYMDNIVKKYVSRDSNTLEFLIQTAYAAATSERASLIYHPSCSDITSSELIKLSDPYIDLTSTNIYVNKLIAVLNTAENDEIIASIIGIKLYKFIRFVIESNRTDICYTSFEIPTSIEVKTSTGVKYHDTVFINDKSVKVFSIKYPSSVENKFNVPSPQYLFHGSGAENWFRMIREGIKNVSGSKLQVNGAAFGSGVYLGQDFNTSYGYARGRLIAVGVVQILGDMEKFKVSAGFYVVPDDTILLLRYIIVLNNDAKTEALSRTDTMTNLTKYFRETLTLKKLSSSKALSKISTKRINGEINKINKEITNYTISCLDDTMTNLMVVMKFPSNKTTEVVINIKVTDDYPSRPPSIAISSPILNIPSKNDSVVNSYGAIIIKDLCNNQWKVANTFIKILDVIYKYLEINNFTSSKGTYDFDKAINSFYEFQKLNGWH